MGKNIMKWFTLGAILLLSGCAEETLVPEPGPVPDGKVRIELYTNGLNYDNPVTRRGSSEEALVDTHPWVLVFYGEGNGAIFAEAQKALYGGNKSYVTLNTRSSKCRVLIIGNTPSTFYNGTTVLSFQLSDIEAALNGQRFDYAMNTLLQTEKLSIPEHTSVPFTGAGESLPMAIVCDLDEITENTKFGTETDKLQMKRVVAKVTVSNDYASGDFVLHSATVVNTPANGRFWELGSRPRSNSGNLTAYYGTGSNRVQQVNNIAPVNASQSTENNPIYIYETRKEDGTSVIVRGTYKGVSGFYRLLFRDAGGNTMDIIRNKYYRFHITGVNSAGYPTPDEAMLHEPSDALTYQIDVTDQSSYEIADNGQYYLGLSHSEVEIGWFDAFTSGHLSGYFGNEPAFIITTNAPSTVTTNITATVTESIPQLGTPTRGTLNATSTGPSSNKINVAGTPTTTEVRVTFDRYFQAGYVTVQVGNLVKQINVRRTGRLSTAAFTQPFTSTDGGYTSAQIERGGQWFTLSFSTNPQTGSGKATSSNPNGETLYMFGDNFFSTYYDRYRTGTATMVRAKDSRRVKLYIEQTSNIQKQSFCYVATFHRHDERGERIILMEGTNFDNYGHVPTVGAWTATIIKGGDFIVIDDDKLGRNMNDTRKEWGVTDPEINLVSDGGTTISGTCDALNPIYFRIGLKGTIGATETRFGAVLLTYNNGANNSIIFVRQGEEPVTVTGPGKWMPYNLSDPNRFTATLPNGGTTISDHNLMTPKQLYSAACFTDYPSQIGYLFQWGVLVPDGGTQKRYAYNPATPGMSDIIAGYPTTVTHLSWNSAYDPCPQGYKTPSPDLFDVAQGGLTQYDTEPSPDGTGTITYIHNSQWGYCADGFFDRRPFENSLGGSGSTVGVTESRGMNVATAGRVFFNIDTFASVFMPTGGMRDRQGRTASVGASNAQYMTTSEKLLTFGAYSMSSYGGLTSSREYARMIRCVKE